MGCYQMALKRYALRIEEGYEFSYKSCVTCDYIHGPFLIETKFLKENFLPQIELQDPFIWIDFFLNIQKKKKSVYSFVCPDVLFQSTIENLVDISRSTWQNMAIHLLYSLE